MNKREFLKLLREKLNGLPEQEIDERIQFYDEMIADRMEEGLAEEIAVEKIGSAEELAWQIISEHSSMNAIATKLKEKVQEQKAALFVVGSPIRSTLLIMALVVAFSLYVSVWAVVISLWAIGASFVGCAIGGVFLCGLYAYLGNIPLSVFALGATFALTGLSIFWYKLCKAFSKTFIAFSKKAVDMMKTQIKKEKR